MYQYMIYPNCANIQTWICTWYIGNHEEQIVFRTYAGPPPPPKKENPLLCRDWRGFSNG